MSSGPPALYDGATAFGIARRCDLPLVELRHEVTSTMDVAHEMAAAGAPSGTLVLAERQLAGRGRAGRAWYSSPGDSITATLVERPGDGGALALLSVRSALAIAVALDRFAESPVRVKWPNDLMLGAGKVGGILAEARWRDQRVEWVAVGVGLNLRGPDEVPAAARLVECSRLEVLAEVIPALRAACSATGTLTPAELRRWGPRDWSRDLRLVQPARGVARGISPDGALIVETAAGIVFCSTGSLVPVEDPGAPRA